MKVIERIITTTIYLVEHTKDGQRKTVPTTNYVAYSKHSRGIYVIAYIHMFLLHNVEAVYDSGSLPRHLDLGPRSVCFGWIDGSSACLPDRRHQLGSARSVSVHHDDQCPPASGSSRYFCVLGGTNCIGHPPPPCPSQCIATQLSQGVRWRVPRQSKGLPVITTHHITRQMQPDIIVLI